MNSFGNGLEALDRINPTLFHTIQISMIHLHLLSPIFNKVNKFMEIKKLVLGPVKLAHLRQVDN